MQINKNQIDNISEMKLASKLDELMRRDLADYAVLSEDARADFLRQAMSTAKDFGLSSELGIGSYALVAWWLGFQFEERSEALKALLISGYPEVRKIHAMMEWAEVIIGEPENKDHAYQKIVDSFRLTEPWGSAAKNKIMEAQ